MSRDARANHRTPTTDPPVGYPSVRFPPEPEELICNQCGHTRRGLAADRPCPECGHLGSRTVVLTGLERGLQRGVRFGAVVTVIGIVIELLSFFFTRGFFNPMLLAGLLLVPFFCSR